MKPDKYLTDKLRAARMDKGLTQADVAKSLGITAQAISNFEHGRNNLSPHYLEQLCKLCDIDPITLKKQSELDSAHEIVDKLVKSSYALTPELRAPVQECQAAFIGAMDGVLRQFNFCKEIYEIDKSIMALRRELEFELKQLSPETTEDYELAVEAYERQIAECRRTFKTFSPEETIGRAVADAQAKINYALDVFSNQLQAILKKAMQETAATNSPDSCKKE